MSGVLQLLVAGAGARPQLSNRTLSDADADAEVELRFDTDGTLRTVIDGTATSRLPEWGGTAVGMTGLGSLFQVRLTVSSGSGPSSSGNVAGVWYTMSSQVRYRLFGPEFNGTNSGTWLVEIRRVGSTTVLASATYTVSAQTTNSPAPPVPELTNRTFNLGSDTTEVVLILRFRRYGTLEIIQNGSSTTVLPEWHGDASPASGSEGSSYSVAAAHEIRFVHLSGNMPLFNNSCIHPNALNVNEWHSLDIASDPTACINSIRYNAQEVAHGTGFYNATFRVDIRRTSDNSIVTQATYNVSGTVT